jgi:hypothetical protein
VLTPSLTPSLSLTPSPAQFVDDCRLANKISKACRKADLDRAFIAADAASGKLDKDEQDDGGNRGKALSPDEFLLCVVNIAIMKYVLENILSDVSDSVCLLVSAAAGCCHQSQLAPITRAAAPAALHETTRGDTRGAPSLFLPLRASTPPT